jgi:hypothetical protein
MPPFNLLLLSCHSVPSCASVRALKPTNLIGNLNGCVTIHITTLLTNPTSTNPTSTKPTSTNLTSTNPHPATSERLPPIPAFHHATSCRSMPPYGHTTHKTNWALGIFRHSLGLALTLFHLLHYASPSYFPVFPNQPSSIVHPLFPYRLASILDPTVRVRCYANASASYAFPPTCLRWESLALLTAVCIHPTESHLLPSLIRLLVCPLSTLMPPPLQPETLSTLTLASVPTSQPSIRDTDTLERCTDRLCLRTTIQNQPRTSINPHPVTSEHLPSISFFYRAASCLPMPPYGPPNLQT